MTYEHASLLTALTTLVGGGVLEYQDAGRPELYLVADGGAPGHARSRLEAHLRRPRQAAHRGAARWLHDDILMTVGVWGATLQNMNTGPASETFAFGS